jgi:argininosuccinate synthase
MERSEHAAFGPTDRIGQLTMRNLDIADTREKLAIYTRAGVLTSASDPLLPKLADDDMES